MAKNIKTLKLSDQTIAQVAKLTQIAILTGTDIVDNLRLLEFVENDGILDPSPDFLIRIENNITEMMTELETGQSSNSPVGIDE